MEKPVEKCIKLSGGMIHIFRSKFLISTDTCSEYQLTNELSQNQYQLTYQVTNEISHPVSALTNYFA